MHTRNMQNASLIVATYTRFEFRTQLTASYKNIVVIIILLGLCDTYFCYQANWLKIISVCMCDISSLEIKQEVDLLHKIVVIYSCK